MELVSDLWLSHMCQWDVYKLDIGESGSISASTIEALINRALGQNRSFIYLKVDPRQTPLIKALEDNAFRLVDTNLALRRPVDIRVHRPAGILIRPAVATDREQVEAIARENLTCSRFHLDSGISNDLAGRIKGAWAGNYFSGHRGDQMLVAEVDGKVAGFLLLILKDRNIIIDLIAVDVTMRGMSIGRELICSAQETIPGYDTMITGTQLANKTALAFYQKLGFHLVDSQYVFHCHRDWGQPQQ